MTPDLVVQLEAEEADLQRKLEAVRAMLAAYGKRVPLAASRSTSERGAAIFARARNELAHGLREKLPIDRFSPYGISVIQAVVKIIGERPGAPVSTRELVATLEMGGLEVRGTDKVNALSALLARSADVMSHGRRGWIFPPAATVSFDISNLFTESGRTASVAGEHSS